MKKEVLGKMKKISYAAQTSSQQLAAFTEEEKVAE
jgi:hypothetical protein